MAPDELVHYAERFRRSLLGSRDSAKMCLAISGPLCALLKGLDVDARLFQTFFGEWQHVFIVLPTGDVLDATADQFNATLKSPVPPVYFGPALDIHHGFEPIESCPSG